METARRGNFQYSLIDPFRTRLSRRIQGRRRYRRDDNNEPVYLSRGRALRVFQTRAQPLAREILYKKLRVYRRFRRRAFPSRFLYREFREQMARPFSQRIYSGWDSPRRMPRDDFYR